MALGLTPYQIIEKNKYPLLRIPDDWVRVELKNIAKVQNGYAFKSNFFNKTSGLPLIRIRDIARSEAENLYSGEYSEDFIVKNKDILIGMDGDFNVSKWPGEKGLLNQRVCRIIPFSEFYNREFLFICLQPYLNAIHQETSAVTVKHLSSKTIQYIPLPLPPLPIQHAIVAKIEQLFSELDNGTQNLQQAKEKLTVFRQAVLKKAFEGELTNHNGKERDMIVNGINARVVESWRKMKLGDYVELQGGFAFKSNSFKANGIPIVKIKNVHSEDIDWTHKNYIDNSRYDEFANYQLEEGDVLIAMTRPVIKSLNTVKLVVVKKYDLPCLLNQRVGRFKIKGELNRDFLKYFLFTEFFKQRVIKESSSSQQPNISSKKVEDFDILVPQDETEQKNAVQEIESRLSVCDEMEKSIESSLKKAEALRQSILKKAFEGELLTEKEIDQCKQEPDWETAEELLARIEKENNKTKK